MFTAVLSVMVPQWKHPKWPETDDGSMVPLHLGASLSHARREAPDICYHVDGLLEQLRYSGRAADAGHAGWDSTAGNVQSGQMPDRVEFVVTRGCVGTWGTAKEDGVSLGVMGSSGTDRRGDAGTTL